jgi:hypothetical protein
MVAVVVMTMAGSFVCLFVGVDVLFIVINAITVVGGVAVCSMCVSVRLHVIP